MTESSWTAIARLAASSYGVFSRAQARSVGISDRAIDLAVRRGTWERLASGVYRIAGTPGLPRTSLAVAVHASGGLASHRSAAELLGLRTAIPARPDVLLADRRRYRGPAVAHRTDQLLASDRTVAGGLACTSAARTLFDLGAVLSEFEVEGLVHRAVRAGTVTAAELDALLRRLARRGRNGTTTMRAILDRLVETGPVESHLELRVLRVLRDHGVPLPEVQVWVRAMGRNYRLDFAWTRERVFLEGDGFGIHTERDAFETDRSRQNRLVREGWLPLRYTDRMLREEPGRVATEVREVLRRRAAAS